MELGYCCCPGAEEGVIYLLVTVTATAPPDASRTPVNLALALDRSSSMRGPRLEQARSAAIELLGKLDRRDRLTLLSFDATAEVIFGPEAVTDESRGRARAALDALDTGVGTNLAAAIRTGAEAVRSGFVRGALSRLIVVTDGQPSVGITSYERLFALVEQEYRRGLVTTTMGVGEGFQEDLLAELAVRGHGGFHYISQPADIAAAFGRELAGVFTIAARETTVKFLPHVSVETAELLHRIPSVPIGDGLEVELGELAAGTPRLLLFRLGRTAPIPGVHLGRLACTYRHGDGSTADPALLGVELDVPAKPEAIRAVQSHRLSIAAARATDRAWARRANGDSTRALTLLAAVLREVEEAHRRGELADADAERLLADLGEASEAVVKGAAEREKLRRGMREKSQLTLLGHSLVGRLPGENDS